MNSRNDAAHDLWAQLLERAAADPNAILHGSNEVEEAEQQA